MCGCFRTYVVVYCDYGFDDWRCTFNENFSLYGGESISNYYRQGAYYWF